MLTPPSASGSPLPGQRPQYDTPEPPICAAMATAELNAWDEPEWMFCALSNRDCGSLSAVSWVWFQAELILRGVVPSP